MTNKTKKEMIRELSEETGMHPEDVRTIVQGFMDKIVSSLAEGYRLELRELGTFEAVDRMAKVGRNPLDPTVNIPIPAKKGVRFSPHKRLRDAVKGLK